MIRVSRDDGDRNAGDWWDLVEAACLPGRVCIFTREGLDAERFTAKVADVSGLGVSVEHVSGPYDNGLPVRMEVLTSDAIIAIDWES